ncbi:MAG: class I SAM-dependent methyltransferase [Bacteroidota bacterium]
MRKLPTLLLLFCAVWLVNCKPKEAKDDASGIKNTYIGTGRYLWQKPEMVLNLFGDLEQKTVADIGAGEGFFTFRLAEKAKKVIAIDISEDALAYLRKSTPAKVKDRVEPRLVSPSSPNLKVEEADAVLLVNTYMYLDNRIEYLKKVNQGMPSNAKILINDFKKKRTALGPNPDIRVPLYRVEQELVQAGFRIVHTDDTSLEYQYIVLAEKR